MCAPRLVRPSSMLTATSVLMLAKFELGQPNFHTALFIASSTTDLPE